MACSRHHTARTAVVAAKFTLTGRGRPCNVLP
jgi:hypothetical protein